MDKKRLKRLLESIERGSIGADEAMDRLTKTWGTPSSIITERSDADFQKPSSASGRRIDK